MTTRFYFPSQPKQTRWQRLKSLFRRRPPVVLNNPWEVTGDPVRIELGYRSMEGVTSRNEVTITYTDGIPTVTVRKVDEHDQEHDA